MERRQSQSPAEIDAWLGEYGWYPGRDIGNEADRLAQNVIQKYREAGQSLELVPEALPFLRSYGLLKANVTRDPEETQVFVPIIVHEGDEEEIMEPSEGIGEKVFPLGYETYDGSTLLVDAQGRYFLQHHTGGYFLGHETYEMFANLLRGQTVDAEEFYV